MMTLKASVKWLIRSNRCTILPSAPEDQRCSAVSRSTGLIRGSQAGCPFWLALFDWQESGNGYWEEEDGRWAELCSPCPLRLVAQRWAADVPTSGRESVRAAYSHGTAARELLALGRKSMEAIFSTWPYSFFSQWMGPESSSPPVWLTGFWKWGNSAAGLPAEGWEGGGTWGLHILFIFKDTLFHASPHPNNFPFFGWFPKVVMKKERLEGDLN